MGEVLTPANRTEARKIQRLSELLQRLNRYDVRLLAVMVALLDDETPNAYPQLAKQGLKFSAAARVQQIVDYIAPRLGQKNALHRETGRDYLVKPLIELGLVERAFVLRAEDLKERGTAELIVQGHLIAKSMNNAYRVTEETRELLGSSDSEWPARLEEWLAGSEERQQRVLSQEAMERLAQSSGASKHSALITACVEALTADLLQGWTTVYVDDADGDRIRPEWQAELEGRNLMLDLKSRYADAMLVSDEHREIWFVDAVTSDGEVDVDRRDQLRIWAEERGWAVGGFTTAYETWKYLAVRQGKHANLAAHTTVWVAEDGGKLLWIGLLAEGPHAARASLSGASVGSL